METSESIRPDQASPRTQAVRQRLGSVQQIEWEQDTVQLTYSHGGVAIGFLDNGTVRIRISRQCPVALDSTDAILPAASVRPVLTEQEGAIRLSTHELEVVVPTAEFGLQVLRRGQSAPLYQVDDVELQGDGAMVLRQAASARSRYYGLGEKTSFLDKSGESYEMWNSDVYAPHVPEIEALYVSIPFLIEHRPGETTGVLLDNPGRSRFDLRSDSDACLIGAETGDLDLYVIAGHSLAETVRSYTALTGRMAMPPKWALGYHQSRYSYMNDGEVRDLVQTFREKGIPLDAVYLDIHYMRGYRVFTFDDERFPQPKALTDALHTAGVRLVTIVDPGVKVDDAYSTYRDGIAEDVFCKRQDGTVYTGEVWPGESAFPDFTMQRVRQWWQEQQKFLLGQGVDGIWNDMNEPAIFDGEGKTMDGEVLHGNDGQPANHRTLHNLYGMLMARSSRDGQLEATPDRRPFVLTRSGYAGIQRYAAVWTGDNRSFWEHMAMAIPMVLNLGLSGVPFTGPDVGGFAHHTNARLLARWTQMGAFFPYFRNHSALDTAYQEPWQFGPEVEAVCREAIALRYRWMPHLYSLFYEAAQTGAPVIRPLVWHYPDDPKVGALSDQFLFGESVLVAPILRPDSDARAVYLPQGVWTDYWTGERFGGGQSILTEAPLDRIPLFIKDGAILPQTAPVQSMAELPQGPLVIEVFAGSEGTNTTFTLYDDDGETLAHEQGAYTLVQLGWDYQPDRATFHYARLHNGYGLPWRGLELRIRGLGSAPAGVEGFHQASPDGIAARTETWTYDEETDTLTVFQAELEEAQDIIILPDGDPVV